MLLHEDQASGGVRTISLTLCQALLQRGWPVRELTLSESSWRQRWSAARQCDVLLASHNFRPAYLAWVLGMLARKPVLVWVHGPLQEVLAQARASRLKCCWLRWLYRRVPYFVFVSRATADSFLRFMQRPLAAHQHAVVIANAVAQAAPTGAAQPEWDAQTVIQLGYVGRLSPEKQPGLLLAMLRLLPVRFRLTLVGDGPLRDELGRAGADLIANGRLTLAGAQPHGAALYTPWQLTLLASLYEGCPMTLLESLAAGVACVALPIPAIREVVGTDAPYLLAHDSTAQALVDAVQAVCALPQRQLQIDMARVLARHQLGNFVQRWQTALQQAAGC